MTNITYKIRTIRHQIQMTLKLIKDGIKSYVDQLIRLEGKLEDLLQEQKEAAKPKLLGTPKQVAWATDIQEVLAEMLRLGVEQLVREECVRNADNNYFETEEEREASVERNLASRLAALNRPRELQGISRLKNYLRIIDASDLIDIGKGVDASYKGFFNVISRIRGNHYSYLD